MIIPALLVFDFSPLRFETVNVTCDLDVHHPPQGRLAIPE